VPKDNLELDFHSDSADGRNLLANLLTGEAGCLYHLLKKNCKIPLSFQIGAGIIFRYLVILLLTMKSLKVIF
jgi:hypothetical protein